MQCQRMNFTTQLSCGLIKRLPQYSSHPIDLRFVTAFKKSHELCHVHHMQAIDLSVCTYAVCVYGLQPMFVMASSQLCAQMKFPYTREFIAVQLMITVILFPCRCRIILLFNSRCPRSQSRILGFRRKGFTCSHCSGLEVRFIYHWAVA